MLIIRLQANHNKQTYRPIIKATTVYNSHTNY